MASLILACGLAPCGSALAIRAAAAPSAAPVIAVVSADDEAEKANPGRHRREHAEAPPPNDFKTMMDRVFGPGRWRETSGYRTVAQENALRRAGAGTVPAGRLSRHSLGDPEAPGAYDAVVAGLTPAAAAARLKRAGAPLARVAAEGAHGREGPHLHIELVSMVSRGASASAEN
ncbi:MAG TPA: hypothetical protein VNW53_14470 [Phenylobacterium sp.]|uniref:hypothetical protein n=1 Tax=Phenylobacterium sp. TaxID=1871053 RepID=UPI002CF4F8D5|nr:hypothetical protein [Phenylobacterium sp.]HXA40201.1 hypothetical protein [Phenylobacterium sp.]